MRDLRPPLGSTCTKVGLLLQGCTIVVAATHGGWCCSALGAALDTGSFSETPRLRDGADCVCPIQLYRARPASSLVDSIPFWDSSHLIRLMGRMSVLVSFKSSFGTGVPVFRYRYVIFPYRYFPHFHPTSQKRFIKRNL